MWYGSERVARESSIYFLSFLLFTRDSLWISRHTGGS